MSLLADEAVVLNPAANAINSVFRQCLDADHPNAAEDRPHAVSIIGLMHWNAEGTLPDFSWHKWRVCQAIEAFAAEILGLGLYEVSRSRTKEADRPVNLDPDASATLANN